MPDFLGALAAVSFTNAVAEGKGGERAKGAGKGEGKGFFQGESFRVGGHHAENNELEED